MRVGHITVYIKTFPISQNFLLETSLLTVEHYSKKRIFAADYLNLRIITHGILNNKELPAIRGICNINYLIMGTVCYSATTGRILSFTYIR